MPVLAPEEDFLYTIRRFNTTVILFLDLGSQNKTEHQCFVTSRDYIYATLYLLVYICRFHKVQGCTNTVSAGYKTLMFSFILAALIKI
jgi:hypothetical protein